MKQVPAILFGQKIRSWNHIISFINLLQAVKLTRMLEMHILRLPKYILSYSPNSRDKEFFFTFFFRVIECQYKGIRRGNSSSQVWKCLQFLWKKLFIYLFCKSSQLCILTRIHKHILRIIYKTCTRIEKLKKTFGSGVINAMKKSHD